MFCKSIKSNKFWVTLVGVGIISFIFGLVGNMGVPDEAGNISMVMGMFTGLGSAFIAIGIVKLIHYKRSSAIKLKQEEIELKDERNIQILRVAGSVANATASALFAIMAFVFVFLDYRIPAFVCLGALYVHLLVFFISYKYYSSRM
jgi:Ca2+/Na+ antiporter